ncbi:hypothetical protein [Candidatus Palauibacter polyketidifaciens]|uniref:hypothetical protein n=1 Tax=Candidatus Palauibacter polyketidifaciens TaxID=3056740 RepID=UPI002872DD77|nr:hypothetical protein [Candidatus Palauibacter polyketidifaciens]
MNHAATRPVGSVTRELGRREHEGKPVHALVATRVVGAGREDLWDAFTRRSSAAWCEASIALGTDRDAARAASVRATAFYTGEGAP